MVKLRRGRGNILLLFLGLLVLTVCSNCANSMRGYVSARTILNDYWESYLNLRDSMPEGAEKAALKAKFADTGKGSYFTDAKDALNVWQAALGTTGEIEAGKLYYTILNKVMDLLVREGVVVIKVK